ncbi:MFS transporter [Saccharopolyspora shandongensis]|uniref:MFS transporter n=1 Tax=Saccharopolyspora shandongensis TaxID=418495 RepID=UPI0033DC1AD7
MTNGTSENALMARSRINFLKIWVGQGASQVGSQISLLAIPTLAILVYHATPFEASVVGALEVVPFTLFSLLAGPLVDRLPRRAVLIVCDVARFAAIATLAGTYLAGLHHMWIIYAVAFVVGTFTVFFDITFMSFIPHVVAKEHLLTANSRLGATNSVAQTAGPSVGGLLIEFLGPARTLVVDAVSYLVSVAALVLVRVKEPRRNNSTLRIRVLFAEIREGLVYVRRSPVLARVALTNAMCDFGQSIIHSVYLVFIYNSLHLPPGQVGFVLAVTGVSFAAGAILLPRVTRWLGFGRTMAFSVLLGMGIELLTPLAMLGFAVVVLVGINIVTGATNAFYDINQLTYRQKRTPDELQGRVHATMRMTFQGPTPFGYLLGGALATFVGVAATIFVGAVVSTIGATALLTGAVLRLRSIDEVDPDPDPGKPLSSATTKEDL